MRRIECLICDGPTQAQPASIAKFLVELCRLETSDTNIRFCRKCDFAFFERRLTYQETGRLYHDYRGKAYDAFRETVEPGYSNIASFMSDELGDYFVKRIDTYTNILRLFPELRANRVLDFGGDGRLASRVFTNSDVSFDDLSAGSNATAGKYDFIFASQVFEHISDIKSAITNLAQMLEPDGALIIDVPKEYEGSISEGLLWQRIHGGALYTMHEHINHYSLSAVEALVASAGLLPFFTVLPPHFRTILTVAGRPDSNMTRRLSAEQITRKLLWHAELTLTRANEANAEARAAHYYSRQAAQKIE